MNLAIIGCGAITQAGHLPAVARVDGVNVIGLVDLDTVRARALADQHGIKHATGAIDDLPRSPDAAILAVPHDLHARLGADLLRRGVHVLVEKPMALSIAECDEMIQASTAAGAVLSVGMVRRFLPEIRLAKKLLDAGIIGPIRSFDVREGRVYDWKTASDFFLKRSAAGGGVLTDAGVHVLDTLLYLLGNLEVTGYADDSYGGVEAEAEVKLTLGNGAAGFMELSRTRNLRNTTRVEGDLAALEIDLVARRVLLHKEGSTMEVELEPGPFGHDIFAAQLADWVDAIRYQRAPMVGGVQGRASIALLEACRTRRTLLRLPWVEPLGPGLSRRQERLMSLRGKRVLVTGGTGFIGGRVVEKLILEHAAAPRVLARKLTTATRVGRFDVEIFPGDVTNRASVTKAMEGCDVVIHCAYGNEGDHDHQRAVNVDGTTIVASEALHAGVRRMVHVSTIAVYGRTPDGDVDESTPLADGGDHYSKTKREAEQILQDQHGNNALSFTIIRPTCVYGPYGLAFTIDPIQQLSSRQVVLVNGGEGLCNAIYVDDLADGILLAAVEPAASGETFLMTAETPLTWRAFYAAYERLLGRQSTIEMTVEEARAYARREAERKAWEEQSSERLRRMGVAHQIKPRPELFRVPSEHGLAFYSARTRFRIDKAKRLFGFQPAFSFADGIELTGQWARWAGLIPAN